MSGWSAQAQQDRSEPAGDVDAVVVGGGPSGLSAARWVARYHRRVVVVDGGEHRADAIETSHGYLGRDPQEPHALLARGGAARSMFGQRGASASPAAAPDPAGWRQELVG
jgi:thioredoxin reductase (NADPH)